ncbi:FecR domain-containing protein [Paenibacillus filicis]|uniref:FecR domain-containing protein n=1 Tax=Paenibacillus filicis TaxID=669464 RepID=A0ABU9DBU4_9BACL
MRNTARIHKSGGRTRWSWVLVVTLVLSLLSSLTAPQASAKSVRSAVVSSVTGEVTYTKAGGSRSISVYPDLSLNQGDLIKTGPGASVILSIVDRNDEITISENAEIYISELMEDGGKKSKVKSWAGSVWSKVKSLVSSEDEFEVETPTAVMGVRGTHWLVKVDPITGNTYVTLGSGIIHASTTSTGTGNNGPAQQTSEATIYPSQQLEVNSRDETDDLRTKIEFLDPSTLVNSASPEIIKQLLQSIADIQRENEELKSRLTDDQLKGADRPDQESSIRYLNAEELEKVQANIDSIISNVLKSMLDENKADLGLIHESVKKLEELTHRKIDLNQVKPLDKTAGLDPEIEKKKQELRDKSNRLEPENKKQEDAKKKLNDAFSKLEDEKKRREEANKQAAAEAAKKAEEALKAQLDEAAKKLFEENNKKNQTPPSNPGNSGSNGSGDSSNPGSSVEAPGKPVLISPTAASQVLVNEDIKVTLTAESGSTVTLRTKSGSVVATGKGNGASSPVTLAFKAAQTGRYELEAVASNEGGTSATLAIPVIEVVDSIPVLLPRVTLKQVGSAVNGQVQLELDMEHFTGKPFYGVQAHLVYDSSVLKYTGPKELPDNGQTLFSGTYAAETLNQKPPVNNKTELIYAGLRFQTATSGNVEEINLQAGAGKLVTVPLQIGSGAPNETSVKLAYVKVVDKQGNTVYELPLNSQTAISVKLTN